MVGSLGGSEPTPGLSPCGGASVGAGGEGSLAWGWGSGGLERERGGNTTMDLIQFPNVLIFSPCS